MVSVLVAISNRRVARGFTDVTAVVQPGRRNYGGGGGITAESFKEVRIGASVHIYGSNRGPILVTNSSPGLMLKAGNLAGILKVRSRLNSLLCFAAPSMPHALHMPTALLAGRRQHTAVKAPPQPRTCIPSERRRSRHQPCCAHATSRAVLPPQPLRQPTHLLLDAIMLR